MKITEISEGIVTSPAAPLRDLAERRCLPARQVMDQATLAWIASNRPPVAAVPAHVPCLPSMLVPEVGWFTDEHQANSIHGIGHNARVSLLAALLAAEHQLDEQDTSALCTAAAIHDCRRRNDRADPGHGRRAARWVARNHLRVQTAFGIPLPPVAVTRMAAAIALHDTPYAEFTPSDQDAYRRAPLLVDLLKTADCLDRYRLPLQRWWPDPSHLRISIPSWLHAVAFDVMLASEQARLDGATHDDALAHARDTLTCGQ
ncbi:hypothetical protein [Nonomuraea sp. NPDC003804]|uniref:hypothetical protein n=1 Tax=Nonomuraea sp. NPDC003804 TaxID=3154547 RepID=UPI0033AD0FEC